MTVPRIQRGGVISYRYLRGLEDAIVDAGRVPGAPATVLQGRIDQAGETNMTPEQAADPRAQRTVNREPVSSRADYTEIRRVTETVRVTNPEDDQQYVDVERVRVVVLSDGRGDRLVLRFAGGV